MDKIEFKKLDESKQKEVTDWINSILEFWLDYYIEIRKEKEVKRMVANLLMYMRWTQVYNKFMWMIEPFIKNRIDKEDNQLIEQINKTIKTLEKEMKSLNLLKRDWYLKDNWWIVKRIVLASEYWTMENWVNVTKYNNQIEVCDYLPKSYKYASSFPNMQKN